VDITVGYYFVVVSGVKTSLIPCALILNGSDIMSAFDERKRTPVNRWPRMQSAIRYATFSKLYVYH
jgi:hypothetical protein